MGELSKQITIEAPPQAIFTYVADPHNAPRYISSIEKIVSGPDGRPEEGQRWRAEANFLGRRSPITLRLEELQPGRLVRFRLEGEPSAILSVRLTGDEEAGRTRVTLLLEVPSVPSILLNALMGGLLAGDLARLKRIQES